MLKLNCFKDEIDELILMYVLLVIEVVELFGMNYVFFKDFYLDVVKEGVIFEVLKVSN